MEIIRSKTPKEDAGKAFSDVLQGYSGKPVLLMLSGGSTMSILDYVDEDVLESNMTLSVLDERCSSDPLVNNFLQLKETNFFKRAVENSAHIISTEVQEGESCLDVADRWKKNLLDWKTENPDGVIVATIGIGPDGHVAGIMPNVSEESFGGEKLVVSYSVPPEVNKYTNRITVTHIFFKEYVDEAVVYAVGDEKRIVIDKLKNRDCESGATPACVLNSMKKVRLYTDLVE